MKYILTVLFSCFLNLLQAQDAQFQMAVNIPGKYSGQIEKKIGKLNHELSKQTEKYLRKFYKREERLRRKLQQVDSSRSDSFFGDTRMRYEILSRSFKTPSGKANISKPGEYIAGLDSIKGALVFLKDEHGIIGNAQSVREKVRSSLNQANDLQDKFNEAAEIQKFLQERQKQMSQLLSGYKNLPNYIIKQFKGYQQEIYYYSQQIREYKAILNSPEQLERKVLTTLQNIPAFQQYMSKYSMLASLFPTPEYYGTMLALDGLQTRINVQQIMQQQLQINNPTNTGINPAQYLQQQIQQAKSDLEQLKEKLQKIGNGNDGNSDLVMPDFKPNSQKTKSFLKRIEFGTSMQTLRSTYYFPTTTDVALTAGYKINDKSINGFGLSGRMGWGKDWKQITVSGQGVGMRAFVEWKVTDVAKMRSRFLSGFWLTGGGEMNYNKIIEGAALLKEYKNWTTSMLVGISKKYNVSSPFNRGKKMRATTQILYDFLYRQHVPATPAFLWRLGYTF